MDLIVYIRACLQQVKATNSQNFNKAFNLSLRPSGCCLATATKLCRIFMKFGTGDL